MYTISGRIQGVAPILFHRLEEGVLEGPSKGNMSHDERIAEAMRLSYSDAHGLYVPPGNFKRCLLDGSTKAKIKEGKASATPYFQATVFVQGNLYFGKDSPDFIHEETGRRPPKTGGRIIVRRPALDTGWELPFSLVVVDDRRKQQDIRRALEEAGLLVGLCDHRPEYGRFIVTDWQPAQG